MGAQGALAGVRKAGYTSLVTIPKRFNAASTRHCAAYSRLAARNLARV